MTTLANDTPPAPLPTEVTPVQSQRSALWQCPLAGLAVVAILLAAIELLFPYPVMDYVKWPVAFAAFIATTFGVYFSGLKKVPPRSWGVPQFLGMFQRGWVYGEGDHFMFPILMRAIITPGWEQLFTYTVKPDAPAAKDKIRVIIGEDRRAVILFRVFDPVRYIAAVNRGIALESSFLDLLRKFVNQMAYAVGIIDEKSLLDEFLELCAEPDASHSAFARRLSTLMVKVKPSAGGDEEDKRVFPDESVNTIVDGKYLGRFRRESALLGFHISNVFAPSIDLPKGIALAAEKKQIQREDNEVLESRMGTIRVEAGKLARDKTAGGLGVSGQDALDRIGLALDQKVTRAVTDEKREHSYPGIPEAVTAGFQLVADALRSRKD